MGLGVVQLLRQFHRLGQHRQDLGQRRGAARPVGADQHLGEAGAVVEAPRQRDPVFANDPPALALTLEVERPGEPGKQADPQLAAPVPHRRQRLFEQLDRVLARQPRAPARQPRAPAGLLVADRRLRQQLGASQPPGDLRRRREGLDRIGRPAGAVAGPAELEKGGRALVLVLDPDLERRPQPGRGIVVGERGARCPRGAEVVLDRPLGAAEWGR